MKLSFEIELNTIHDLILFDTMLENIGKDSIEEEQDDEDDAEDEPRDRDNEPAEADVCFRMFPETAEEKAYRKALDDLVECLRAFCNANVSYRVLRNRGL